MRDLSVPAYFHEFWISPHLHGGIERYLNDHIAPGAFLLAVLENNLKVAVLTADADSLESLAGIVFWLREESPGAAYGSSANVAAWLARRDGT
jgi:hypothetical protein